MPIATRYVEPRSVCADPLLTEEATRAGDALQAVAVRSTAGLIRQLGSLARHAESVMGELAESLASCHARTLDLERRTRALTEVLPGLDPDGEVLEGFEIPHPDLQFKSDKTIDQRLLSQQKHVSPALLEQYSQARAPPDLGQFSLDWEDGRNAMHFYSNPDFFFENWREGIQKQALRRVSQMDVLSPKHEADGGKKKRKQGLEASTGSDKVSSFVQPVKRTFSLSKKPSHPRKSIYGSTQSLNTDPAGYRTMPTYTGGRQGLPRRSSPSFHSAHSNRHNRPHPHNKVVMRSQSVRNRGKRRPYSLVSATASLYVEQNSEGIIPKTTLEESSKYEYNDTQLHKKSSSSLRRSHSFSKTKSKSPVPGVSTSSVLDSLHMYTVAEELAKLESSPFGLLPKYHLERLDLGSASFDTCLAIEPPKKEQTTFRSPIGVRQRPVSSLDMHLVAMRNDGTGASRSTNRLKHLSAADIATVPLSSENHDSFPAVGSNSPLFGIGGIVLRRRISMTGTNAQARPVSASFVDPPTVKKMAAASRMSLQPHGGSLTDLTRPDSPSQGDESPTTTPKIRPKRPAPQAPGGPRPPSRTGTPESGRSTPKGFRTQSPLVGYQTSLPNIPPSPPRSSQEKFPGMTPNGRVTPTGSPIIGNHLPSSPTFNYHRQTLPSPPKVLPLQRNISSPQLPSPPQLLAVVHRNTSSPQLPMIPIQEEDTPVIHSPRKITPSSPRQIITPSSPLQIIAPSSPLQKITPSSPPIIMNGHVPGPPPPYLRRDSLYISPRKQSLTLSTADKKRLRASQILETGGIRGGDLSSSRMDLLEAIRKGIQLKRVEKKEREKEDLVSMPWDVAAILERRLALELDSDTSEEESNDTEWEDED